MVNRINQFVPAEFELDNLLVQQKNDIIGLINNNLLAEAAAALNTVAPLWARCNYEYKVRELRERIQYQAYLANPMD